MPGLGQRLLGATVRGAGLGIVEEAKQRREDTLLALRRKWQTEDRKAAADLTRKGWDRADERAAAGREHQEGLTREGWDRADERQAGQLVKALDADGNVVYVPQRDAAGMAAPTSSQKLYPMEDPRTGAVIGYQTGPEALAATRGRGQAAAGASADAKAAKYVSDNGGWFTSDKTAFGGDPGRFQGILAGLIADNPSRPISELAQTAKRRNAGEGGSGKAPKRPAGVPANAVQAPPGTRGAGRWFAPDGKGGWLDVTPGTQ